MADSLVLLWEVGHVLSPLVPAWARKGIIADTVTLMGRRIACAIGRIRLPQSPVLCSGLCRAEAAAVALTYALPYTPAAAR